MRDTRFSFGSSNFDTGTYKFPKDKVLKSRGRRMKQNFMNENHFKVINFAPNFFDHDEE